MSKYIEGFKNFSEFKTFCLKNFSPHYLDLVLSGGSGGQGFKSKDRICIYPHDGGCIVLRKDGTWGYDAAPFCD